MMGQYLAEKPEAEVRLLLENTSKFLKKKGYLAENKEIRKTS